MIKASLSFQEKQLQAELSSEHLNFRNLFPALWTYFQVPEVSDDVGGDFVMWNNEQCQHLEDLHNLGNQNFPHG